MPTLSSTTSERSPSLTFSRPGDDLHQLTEFVSPMSARNSLNPILEASEIPPKRETAMPIPPLQQMAHQHIDQPPSYVRIPESNTINGQSYSSSHIGHENHQESLTSFTNASNSAQIPARPLPGQHGVNTSLNNTSSNNTFGLSAPPSGLPTTSSQHNTLIPAAFAPPHGDSYSSLLLNSGPPSTSIPSFSMNESSYGSLPTAGPSNPLYQSVLTPDTQASFRVSNNAMRDKDDQILVLKTRIGELEELVSKLSGIASFSYVNTSASAAENADSVIAYQGPIHDVWNMTSSELNWRFILLRALPSRDHCKVYVDYYFEHVDYIYHPLHNITFLKELDAFWTQDSNTVDIIWVSILFMIISLSSLHLPKNIAKKLKVDDAIFSLSQSSALWFRASRQALQAGGFDEKPTFQQLQTFSLTQLYLYATNQTELLNSLLSQAIRHCQVLGLHADAPGADCIETELRRRIWWDICGCDTFQSLCMGRPTLVNSYASSVPFPLNCHEADMTSTEIKPQLRSVPTIMSFQIERNLVMRILNQLYSNVDGNHPSYEEVLKTDQEIGEYVKEMPWFFRLGPDGELASGLFRKTDKLTPDLDYIHFQNHILHTCVCMHRVRIHQPFLQQKNLVSWNACLSSVKHMFAVYNQLRRNFGGVGGNYNFITQIHQAFSGAVAQGLFLLVEKPGAEDTAMLMRDVITFIEDLNMLTKSFFVTIPILTDGINALSRIRDMIDKGTSVEKSSKVVSGVYSVFGGKKVTETYLERCTINYLVNSSSSTDPPNTFVPSDTGPVLHSEHYAPPVHIPNLMPQNYPMGPLASDLNSNAQVLGDYYSQVPDRDVSSTAGLNMWNFPSPNDREESVKLYNEVNGSNSVDMRRVDLLSWQYFVSSNS